MARLLLLSVVDHTRVGRVNSSVSVIDSNRPTLTITYVSLVTTISLGLYESIDLTEELTYQMSIDYSSAIVWFTTLNNRIFTNV